MKTGLFFIPLAGLLLANAAQAAVCQNVNGAPTTVDYDLSTTLTAAQNAAGNTVQLTKNQEVNVQAVCPAGSAFSNRTYRSYVSPYAVVETSGPWKYLKLDPDYLEGAMRIDDSAAGTLYLPTNYAYMGTDDSVNAGKPFYIRDSNLVFQLKIARPFVGTVTITPKTMFNVYVTTGTSDPLSNVVYNIAYSGGFNRAGAKPVSVRNKKFRVPVKCSGVNSQVNLSLRLIATADTHLNQAIASDNPGVGVVVETNDGAVLTPNDASSVVPFVTDDAGKANIALQAYPVSTTGEIPAEGVFTALANLRVDFD